MFRLEITAFFLVILLAKGLAGQTPESTANPAAEEEGAAEFQAQCVNCHALGIRAFPRRQTKTAWQAISSDMLERAGQSTENAAVIAAYLARHHGKIVNINQATEKEITGGLLLTAKDAQAILRYRRAHGPFKDEASLLRVPGIDARGLRAMSKNIAY